MKKKKMGIDWKPGHRSGSEFGVGVGDTVKEYLPL